MEASHIKLGLTKYSVLNPEHDLSEDSMHPSHNPQTLLVDKLL